MKRFWKALGLLFGVMLLVGLFNHSRDQNSTDNNNSPNQVPTNNSNPRNQTSAQPHDSTHDSVLKRLADNVTSPAADEGKAKAEQAAKQLAEDKAHAARMHVSLDAYRWGNEMALAAHTACQSGVADSARYGSRSDWFPKYSWSTDNNRASIVITGEDMQLKNAFNAQQYVRYSCIVRPNKRNPNAMDPSDWSATVTGIDPLGRQPG